MTASYIRLLCRIVILLVFCMSAGAKVVSSAEFEVTISEFGLFPRRWSGAVARLVTGTESLIAVFLGIGGRLATMAFPLAIVVLCIFSVVLATALRRKLNIRCNCFGRGERRVSAYDVARNAVLVLCGIIGFATSFAKWRAAAWDRSLLLAIMGIGVVLIVTNLDDVVTTMLRPFPVPGDTEQQ